MREKNTETAVAGSGRRLGVAWVGEADVEFSVCCDGTRDLILHIYLKDREIELPMNAFHVFGDVYSVRLTGPGRQYFEYAYTYGGDVYADEYAPALAGRGAWGKPAGSPRYCCFDGTFDWAGDEPLGLPMHELIMYKLHVRGFTMDSSSGVRHKGTFLGVAEKIDYFKRLGVNCVELMPAVEFEEMVPIRAAGGATLDASWLLPSGDPAGQEQRRYRMNYWGYGWAHYFAPKAAYSAGNDPTAEFKAMVAALHRAGIEVVMEFYFDGGVNRNLVLDCLRYWVLTYHVDGFHVNREALPAELAATDPVLARTKLFTEDFGGDTYGYRQGSLKHLADYNDAYAVCCRKFLKGDAGMVGTFSRLLLKNDPSIGSVRYLCGHNGFRLADLVSYSEKHNEANGENNADGTDENFSWNCGVEGPTRKRRVTELRHRQMKNAWVFTLIHQGIPVIFAGDELGQTQQGNNNPYCQDNDLTWLNWNLLKRNRAMFSFVRDLICLRRDHPMLHAALPVRMMDFLNCGHPDVSLHGGRPWRVESSAESRYLGVLYCGRYAPGCSDSDLYFAYNMHWEPKMIGLPSLPRGQVWQQVLSTWGGGDVPVHADSASEAARQGVRAADVAIPPRTIAVFVSRGERELM